LSKTKQAKTPGWIHVFWTNKLYLRHWWKSSYYCCKQSGGKSWNRKGWNCNNDKRNI